MRGCGYWHAPNDCGKSVRKCLRLVGAKSGDAILAGQGADDVGSERRWEGNGGSRAFSIGVCGAVGMTRANEMTLVSGPGLHRWCGREHRGAWSVFVGGNIANGANTHGLDPYQG